MKSILPVDHDEIREAPVRRTCMLMITYACNLKCSYCYEHFKRPSHSMTVEKAKEIIKKEFEYVRNSERFKELEIDFMGGEPLLNYALIREVVEWLENSDFGVPYICFATTNGTLLNKEKKEWFRAHKDSMVLGASYDGVEDSQAVNRGEAAALIDLDFFRTTWPEQSFKMTISKSGLKNLAKSFIYAAENGYPIFASFAQGEDWDMYDAMELRNQLLKLKDFYIRNPEYKVCNLLERPLATVGGKAQVQPKFCGAGTGICTYDVDGTKYACHMFTPIVLGDRAITLESSDAWDKAVTDESCVGCGLIEWCPTCIGFNNLARGCINKRDKRWCLLMAVTAQVSCIFQLERYDNERHKHELNDDEIEILRLAYDSYDYLSKLDIKSSFPQ